MRANGSLALSPTFFYAKLNSKVSADYYSTVDGILYFRYNEEYNAGQMKFAIYNSSRVAVVSNTLTPGLLTPATKVYGDNKFSIDLNSIAAGLYTLEVTNEKNENFKLKFKK